LLDPQLVKALKKVFDPELNINIVDLGLVYQAKLVKSTKAYIQITLTSPGCPLSFVIEDSIHNTLKKIGIGKVKLEITFEPPWTPDRLSKSAKAKLKTFF